MGASYGKDMGGIVVVVVVVFGVAAIPLMHMTK